ncbi:unnamed protein product [Agarophyton chilense]|eukprot:gb/GEZJ01005614.1/.p1 GENE.gb/GEZJ01005614.1/~~gb/GEZJ01005614.1/.p1  ORF type:complete len:923 (+),score=103.34 gb/GEZJ01005614.1/:660-3428(+)
MVIIHSNQTVLTLSSSLISWIVHLLWTILVFFKTFLKRLERFRSGKELGSPRYGGVARGKTVLVTTGRQAKTLHTVRALKEIGATVIVTDYHFVSASALSLACDKFLVLPPLDTDKIQPWIQSFRHVLVENNVDMVLPVSTINEVLFLALAKHQLESELPHIQWVCPDLEVALRLDDRAQFSNLCEKNEVSVPESGLLTSTDGINQLSKAYEHGIILKRVQSSVNRREEIVHIGPEDVVPNLIQPSLADPWQWQRFIVGKEYSVWYVCINGCVTFTGCYHAEPDLLHFDPAPVDKHLDKTLRNMIKRLNLTGQFAFDFIQVENTGRSFVIECNPRASSILETVSNTPLWAESFFGVDVTKRTVYSNVGFLFHRNCWPWTSRCEGYCSFYDPLPFFGAEVVWPLNAIATKGLTKKSWRKIDVNICKIILDGNSASRGIEVFRENLARTQIDFALQSIRHIDTLFLDVTVPDFNTVFKKCEGMGVKMILLRDEYIAAPPDLGHVCDVDVVRNGNITDKFLAQHIQGETRILLGSKLSQLTNSSSDISYRTVKIGEPWNVRNEIPLRRLRILHVMGSSVNEFYETLSTRYGYDCIENVGTDGRFEHVVVQVSPSRGWSVEPFVSESYILNNGKWISPGQALMKIEKLGVDIVLPHMYDYEGMTAVRSVFDILKIPLLGCTADALALSTNKARTNACARAAGVRVPDFEVLKKGEKPTLTLPFVIKPSEEDNSQGITVVYEPERIDDALHHAFQFCEDVMCEEFIAPGREVRVAVVEEGDESLEMLPVIEYFITPSDPVRTTAHKLDTTKTGTITKLKGGAPGGVTLPASIDPALHNKLYQMVTTAHKSLGCRDYSIYDIRIDPDGEPVLLETCLYCSFAPTSVLVKMQAAMGIDKRQLFNRLCEKALTRRILRKSSHSTGMKLRH